MPNFSGDRSPPHIALLPSAGMGHITPFCRLAAALSSRNLIVSFIAVEPTVSSTESLHLSELFASHPNIHRLPLHLPLSTSIPGDPFFLRFASICKSSHLLPPLLATASPPITALVLDVWLASAFLPSSLPTYILSTSSARMLGFCASFTGIKIPGLLPTPHSSIPAALHDPKHIFTTQFVANSKALLLSSGILVNSFRELEPEAFRILAGAPELPKAFPIGPLLSSECQVKNEISLPKWLDEQPEGSVVYVNFGSRTAMSKEQMRELAIGLEASGCRFLWVVKTSVVDKDEEHGISELLGDGFLAKVEGRGLVIKGWVDQEAVLRHVSVGGFLSHCGWNSVTEAAVNGVRVLAWPRHGDQRVNAEVVRGSGLGMWVEEWGWEAEERVVVGEEIARRVKEFMGDEELRTSAARVKQDAAMAMAEGGSSDEGVKEFIGMLKKQSE